MEMPEWRDRQEKWERLAEQDKWDEVTKEFRVLVKPVLDEIRVSKPVSDLRSLNKGPLPKSAGPTTDTINWVDLVLSGGGVLGYAHVGYVLALEDAGLRFRAIGGASAGAVAAFIMGAVRKSPDAPVADDLLRLMVEMPTSTFDDGGKAERALLSAITGILEKRISTLDFFSLPLFPFALGTALKNSGLHPGKTFEDWLKNLMNTYGAGTLSDLKAKCDLSKIEWLKVEDGRQPQDVEGLVCCVAADITTSTKAVLSWERPVNFDQPPVTHSELYMANPDGENPGHCVRASMAVPFFFFPKKFPVQPGEKIPYAGQRAVSLPDTKWKEIGFEDYIPDQVTLVDGGFLSNHPVDLFHVPREKAVWCPTFCVNLSPPRKALRTRNLIETASALLSTGTQTRDFEFVAKNKEYNLLSASVYSGGISALNFDVSPVGKYVLFYNGVVAAYNFLVGGDASKGPFNWEDYKSKRKNATY
ncbi:hypothetical protein ACKKBF_B09055 [Auxenochlorella protothecoides x Auxenochlorella symbiontica]